MNPMDTLFWEHPRREGVTYWQHFQRAMFLSTKMALGSASLMIHAVVPALFEKTGSAIIHDLEEDIQRVVQQKNKDRKTD